MGKDHSEDICRLVTAVQKLDGHLKVKKTLLVFQDMLQACHTAVKERGLHQAILLEQTLDLEKDGGVEGLMDSFRREDDLREFLDNPSHLPQDKLRLLIIFLAFSKGLSEERILALLTTANLSPTCLNTIYNLERFHVNVVKESAFLNPINMVKSIQHTHSFSTASIPRRHTRKVSQVSLHRQSRSRPDSYGNMESRRRLSSQSLGTGISTLERLRKSSWNIPQQPQNMHHEWMKLKLGLEKNNVKKKETKNSEETEQSHSQDQSPFLRWKPFVRLLAEDCLKENPTLA